MRVSPLIACCSFAVFCTNALAADGGLRDEGLEQIVVTAQRFEEPLQDVPISITALSAPMLDDRQIQTLTDLQKAVPNTLLVDGGSGSGKAATVFIRDIGQGDYQNTVEPGVAIYLDDEYLATLYGSMMDLLDLERVEVLRGPQGTLFGRNSIGGAIRLISKKPQGDDSGDIVVGVGNMGRRDFRASLDLPLVTGTVFLRLSASSRQRDGYVQQLSFACVHPDLGGVLVQSAPLLPQIAARAGAGSGCQVGSLGGVNVQAARAALRWLPTESLTVDLVADGANDHSGAAVQTLLSINRNTADPSNPLPAYNAIIAIPLYGIPYDRRFIPSGFYQSYASFSNLAHFGPSPSGAVVTGITSSPAADGVRPWGVHSTIEWSIAPSLTLRSITSYRGYSGLFSDDTDTSPLNETFQENVLDHHQFTQEIQLHGEPFDGRLDWTTGLFYFTDYNLNRGPVILSALSVFDPQLDFNQNDAATSRDDAAYAQSVWHALPALALTAGIRYTRESKSYTFDHSSFDPEIPSLVPPTRKDVAYSRTDWRGALDYAWTERFNTYLSVTTGFRGGGFNGRPFNVTEVTSFLPETLLSYEVGLKGEWLDHRLRVNAAAFLSDYRQLQLSILTIDGMGMGYSAPVNVGHAQITGGEFELEARPWSDLTLSAALGVNRFVYKNLGAAVNCNDVAHPLSTPAPGANCTIDGPSLGTPPPSFPQTTAGINGAYTLHLPGGATLTSNLGASFQSALSDDANGNQAGHIASRTLVDGRLRWLSAHGAWSASLLVTNLLNKEYQLGVRDLSELWGMVLGQPGPPREWALELGYAFGQEATTRSGR
jgi:iron complex outermembrane receptor protein